MIRKIVSWLGLNNNKLPNIRFGRYSDAFKSPRQYAAWEKSIKAYDQKNFLEAYQHFFDYLLDTNEQNVRVKAQKDRIDFEIFQGSKLVKGYMTPERIIAEAPVVKYQNLNNVAFMRRLLELNYSLRYSHFALTHDSACLKFDSSTLDGSPDKLYLAFKEMAINADKQDDLLLEEFNNLIPINDEHIQDTPINEKEVKYTFLQKWITTTLDKVGSLNRQRYETNITYLLLNLVYKIDYFLLPQGKLTNELEEMCNYVYRAPTLSKIERNDLIINKFRNIQQWNKQKVFKELYKVKSTYGMGTTTRQQVVAISIAEELRALQNFRNKISDLERFHLEYIPLSAMFHYDMQPYTHTLFSLIIEAMNADYLKALGFKELLYDPQEQKLNNGNIQNRLKQIQRNAQDTHTNFKLNTKVQDQSLNDFVEGLLKQIQTLDYDD